MVDTNSSFSCFLFFSLLTSLFFPWELASSLDTYLSTAIFGFQILLHNIPVLVTLLLIMMTHFHFLKNQKRKVFLLLEIEILILTALLLYPSVSHGPEFFSAAQLGYFIALGVLVVWNLYNSFYLLKPAMKRGVQADG